MEIIFYSSAIVAFAILVFLIIEKPYYLSSVLLFMMIYRFNIEVPGPLDARGLLLLTLFTRLVIFDKSNMQLITEFLVRNLFFLLIFSFITITFIVTLLNSLSFVLPLKVFTLAIVSVLLGFVIVYNKDGRKAFMWAIVVSGLVSVFDLGLHYYTSGAVSGKLSLIRPLDIFIIKKKLTVNHNFPGLLTGIAFIFVYLKNDSKKWNKIFSYFFLLIFFLGIFISTSRSTLLAVVFVLFIINISSGKLNQNIKKVILTSMTILVVYFSFYFIYNVFLYLPGTKDTIVDTIYFRLYEEPAQIFSDEPKKFDIYSGQTREGSINFRLEKAEHDINKFIERNLIDQFFGLGKGGYGKIGQKRYIEQGKFSYMLNAHNGLIMVLIETGFVGLLLFLVLSIGIIIRSLKLFKGIIVDMPVVYMYLLLFIYAIGQNSELTSSFSFLLIGGMIGNISEVEDFIENEKNENSYES